METSRVFGRREFLVAAGAMGLLGGLAACSSAGGADTRPLALVYRGPASTSGCPEAVATLLETGPTSFRTVFCGPGEDVKLTKETLATATVYAQPGGGSLEPAWRKMRSYADDIRGWVHGGGHYLGFCLGGYLAGATPGFALLPGDTAEYVSSRGATVSTVEDTIVEVSWRGRPRHMFFQDGPQFKLNPGAAATVLATYQNGAPAAVVATYGAGRVGVVGPHPEADRTWYTDGSVTNPDGIHPDLGYDLVTTTLHPTPTPTT